MELYLFQNDLRQEHQNLNASQTKFEHFGPEAQAAIRLVGRGMFLQRDTYNAINAPAEDPWEDDETFPRCDWQYEVANGDTNRGYREWLDHKREELESDEARGLA